MGLFSIFWQRTPEQLVLWEELIADAGIEKQEAAQNVNARARPGHSDDVD
ncbi:hypothetical protein H8A95_22895 [Bradyrhizobium sp. Pear76]|nr:hypothetical protein [Bradyrhizobium oropedii]MCC8965083.1 hypothetical protein [Bradyrhizobium oropedii]